MPFQSYGATLNAPVLYEVACTACKSLPTEDSATSGTPSINLNALVPIVFSAAAIEAFLNELPGFLSRFPELLHRDPSQVADYVKKGNALINERGSCGSTQNKYVVAHSILSGRDCVKSDAAYEHFELLFAARDGLLHAKSISFSGEADPSDGRLDIEMPERLLGRFRSLNILNNSPHSFPIPGAGAPGTTPDLQTVAPIAWILQIANHKAACWACKTAADVVDGIVSIVPEGPHKDDLSTTYKCFRRMSSG
ncbi:MAG: hypothetical protein ABJA50_10445 [Chloroflexota bacterium]